MAFIKRYKKNILLSLIYPFVSSQAVFCEVKECSNIFFIMKVALTATQTALGKSQTFPIMSPISGHTLTTETVAPELNFLKLTKCDYTTGKGFSLIYSIFFIGLAI